MMKSLKPTGKYRHAPPYHLPATTSVGELILIATNGPCYLRLGHLPQPFLGYHLIYTTGQRYKSKQWNYDAE